MTDKPSTAADGRGLLGPDFLGGMDPADWVRAQRDAEPLPDEIQARIDWVNSQLPEGMQIDTSPVLPRTPPSRDFVPEPYPRPGMGLLADYALSVAQRAAQVQECPVCGGLCDGDGPEMCPDCEDYVAVLPGVAWDED